MSHLRNVIDQAPSFGINHLQFSHHLAMYAEEVIEDPQRVILGGLGMRLQDVLLEPALRVYAEEVLPEAGDVCEIVPAALGESIGDYAALCAAYDQGGLLVSANQMFERV